jgi:hypothetical protein
LPALWVVPSSPGVVHGSAPLCDLPTVGPGSEAARSSPVAHGLPLACSAGGCCPQPLEAAPLCWPQGATWVTSESPACAEESTSVASRWPEASTFAASCWLEESIWAVSSPHEPTWVVSASGDCPQVLPLPAAGPEVAPGVVPDCWVQPLVGWEGVVGITWVVSVSGVGAGSSWSWTRIAARARARGPGRASYWSCRERVAASSRFAGRLRLPRVPRG